MRQRIPYPLPLTFSALDEPGLLQRIQEPERGRLGAPGSPAEFRDRHGAFVKGGKKGTAPWLCKSLQLQEREIRDGQKTYFQRRFFTLTGHGPPLPVRKAGER
jgi:hypothetical protein